MSPTWHPYTLTPRDILFFRDARPSDNCKADTETFVVGHGANWPRPDHLYNAVIHALIGDPEANAERKENYGDIQDLNVQGPFPERKDRLYFPRPLDWGMELRRMPSGETDLPAPLTCAFLDKETGKKEYPAWISQEDYKAYLRGEEPTQPEGTKLFFTEHRLGTTLDDTTGASKRMSGQRSGQYGAEYLALARGVTMRADICRVQHEGEPVDSGRAVRFGGQGGTATLCKAERSTLLETLSAFPKGTPSRVVRWTLLTPALFTTGWRPSWVAEDGRVMLPVSAAEAAVVREPGEKRADYRKRVAAAVPTFATARLIGACLNREPIAFSGWDSQAGATPTLLAVPPGTVYAFACDTEAEAEQLRAQLNLRNRSDLGEKGFGLGLASFIPEPQKTL
ncbi:MAG: type III-B CRISPR module-associated Cmr3 family protein [Candidatus Spyradenecus sp.]